MFIAKCGNGCEEMLVDDKVTACVKYVSWMLYVKFQLLTGETFGFVENICNQCLNFVL